MLNSYSRTGQTIFKILPKCEISPNLVKLLMFSYLRYFVLYEPTMFVYLGQSYFKMLGGGLGGLNLESRYDDDTAWCPLVEGDEQPYWPH